MSIIGAIMGQTSPDYLNDPNYWGGLLSGARRTTSGEMVSGETAMTLPAYWACIRNVAEDIAKMSVGLYRRDGRNRYPADQEASHWLVHDEPNPEMSDFTFRETLTQWGMGWGNGYAEIQRDGRMNPVALWPIHPGRVRCKRDKTTERLYYEVSASDVLSKVGINAGGVRIEAADMLHIRGMGSDIEGYSVFRAASESIGRAIAIQKFGAAFFGNGLNVNTVLMHPGQLGEEAIKHLRAQMAEDHSGAGSAFRPFIAEEGMKLERISLPPEEAQALETGEFMVEEICRWFRMPPHKVQHLKRSTFSNIGSQAVEYVVDTLLAWVTRWDKELKRKLLTEGQRRTHFFKHNMETLLRGDPEARAKWIESMVRNGVYTINDVLDIEDMNGAGPQGDQRFIPVNMTTAERMLTGNVQGESPATPAREPEAADAKASDRAERLLRAGTRMFSGEIDRHVRKQAKAAPRAAEKHAGDRPAFEAWAEKFYAELARDMADGLTPLAEGLADLSGCAASGTIVSAFVDGFTGGGRRSVIAAFDEDAVALVAEGWTVGLSVSEAGKLAAAIVGGAA